MASVEELLSAPSALPFLSILVAVLSVLFLFSTIGKRRNIRLPPSPPTLPIIGNLHQIGELYHRSFYTLSLKYGPFMLVRLGRAPWLIVSSPEMACAVLRTHDTNFASQPPAVTSDILRYKNLAFEPYNDDWKQLRKIFTVNLLSPKKLASYKAIREEEVGNLIEKINRHAATSKGEPIDLSKHLFMFMLDIVCRVVSGKMDVDDKKRAYLKSVIEENFNLLGRFSIGDMFPALAWLENYVGLGKRAKKNVARWDKVLDEILQIHIEKAGSDEGHNFVDTLLSLKDDHDLDTKNIINGLLVDAFSAGVHTTYITLGWAMAELIRKPETMKKLQAEVRGIVKRNELIRTEDLENMEYLRAVIKEILRLHPPTPILLPRVSMEDCVIDGYTIPKGTGVLVNCWAIQRDPKSWDAPEEFIPERFMGSPVDYKGNDFHFLPFGSGRRICPGFQMASATANLALANLVHQFDWELPEGVTVENFDMSEEPALSVHRKDSIELVPKKVIL